MVALIDLDSMLYKAVYKVVSITEMKEAIKAHGKEKAKQWLLSEVYDIGINRVEKQILEVIEYVDSKMFSDIESSELFITTCTKSFRKELAPSYKANRKRNKYVWLLRNHYMINDAKYSDTLEADDLISIRANELGLDNCIVISPDKDLRQIGGFYFSYYKVKEKDFTGENVIDEVGLPIKVFQQKEVEWITTEKANFLFWVQMLMGDTSDNIKGLHRVGIKTAEKTLKDSKCYWFTTAREYIKRNQKEDWKVNYQLLKLKTK